MSVLLTSNLDLDFMSGNHKTSPTIRVDFISDIACPWCAVGLGHLEQAIAKMDQLGHAVDFEIHFWPFELNPQMPLGGQEVIEHLTEKYGMTVEQVKANQAVIRERAKAAGFAFHPEGRKWVYNTFHAHRLLHWAGKLFGLKAQYRLKRELLKTYFTLAVSLDDPENLLDAVERAGLDRKAAVFILQGNQYTDEVREAQTKYLQMGVHSVPTFILNHQYLIQGAQPPETLVESFQGLLKEQAGS
jgi:hypothetical protein